MFFVRGVEQFGLCQNELASRAEQQLIDGELQTEGALIMKAFVDNVNAMLIS